jgi:hypothetical protein
VQLDELAMLNVLNAPPHQLRGNERGYMPLFGRMSLGFQSLRTPKFDMEFCLLKKIQRARRY